MDSQKICPNCGRPHVCAACGGAKGGRAKVKKGFALKQPTAEARRRAWETRRRNKGGHNGKHELL